MKNQFFKITAIAFLVGGMAISSHAQTSDRVWSIGPELGVNFAKYGMDADENEFNTGLHAGAFVTYSIQNSFGLTGRILFSQKGSKYSIADTEYKERLNYIEVPIVGRAFFNREGTVRPNIFVGPSFAFLTGAKIKVGDDDYEDVSEFGDGDYKDFYNTFDFGITGGLGLNIKVGEEIYLIIDGRYTHGLSDVSKSDDDINNQAISVSAGVSFGIGN